MTPIVLPFPSAKLAGHAEGRWRGKAKVTKRVRRDAYVLTREVAASIVVPPEGDIGIEIHFFPPDDRGDRVNYPNRMKPYFDGIADALDVNDKRFLPYFYFHPIDRQNGRVEVFVG